MTNTYRISGKMDPVGVLIGLGAAIVAMFPLAFAYSYATRYIPFIYLNFIISFGAVFLVAMAYTAGEGFGHNRSRAASLVGMLIAGVLTLYVFWVTFIFVLLRHEVNYFQLLFRPDVIKEFIKLLIENGWFQVRGNQIKGVVYGAMLGIEAVVYLGIFVFMWWTAMKEKIYCESCRKWVERNTLPFTFHPDYEGPILQSLQAGTDQWLDQLVPFVGDTWLKLELADCEGCRNLSVLNVIRCNNTVNKDGNTETNENSLVENLLLSPAVRNMLLVKCQEMEALQPVGEESDSDED